MNIINTTSYYQVRNQYQGIEDDITFTIGSSSENIRSSYDHSEKFKKNINRERRQNYIHKYGQSTCSS